MSNARISVVIGSYNRENYIRECIDSVLAQTRPADEVVVVDDASTDQTVELLKTYGDKIRLICRASNSGNCAAARNEGMRACSGDFIAFLDSDDAWLPEKLASQLAFFELNPDIPFCHTYCEVMDGASKGCGVRHEGSLRSTGDQFSWLLEHCWICTSSVMFRRALLEDIGYMNEDPRHRIGEDWEFFLRVARKYSIGLVPEVLARYRKSDAGISTTDWRHAPRSVMSRLLLLESPDYWRGKVDRHVVVDELVKACRDSSIFWRDQGYADRAQWFAWIWLKYRPWDMLAWTELCKNSLKRWA